MSEYVKTNKNHLDNRTVTKYDVDGRKVVLGVYKKGNELQVQSYHVFDNLPNRQDVQMPLDGRPERGAASSSSIANTPRFVNFALRGLRSATSL